MRVSLTTGSGSDSVWEVVVSGAEVLSSVVTASAVGSCEESPSFLLNAPLSVITNTTMNAASTTPAITRTAMVFARSLRCFCSRRVSCAFSTGADSTGFGWLNRRSTNSVMVRIRLSGESWSPSIITAEMFAGIFRFIIIGSSIVPPLRAIASVGVQPVRHL